MRKALRFLLIGVVLLLILVPAFLLGPYFLRVEQFVANPARGFHADFFLYVSPQAKSMAKAGNVAPKLPPLIVCKLLKW